MDEPDGSLEFIFEGAVLETVSGGAIVQARFSRPEPFAAMNTQSPSTSPGPESGMANVIERNIHALVMRRRVEEENRRLLDRVADQVTAFTGSMRFVYLHLFIFGMWIIINLGWVPFIPRFEPSFGVLAMVASEEALFLSTFVLITQNRMARKADQKANLDLQISLWLSMR